LFFFIIPLAIVFIVSFHSRGPRGSLAMPFTDEHYYYVTGRFYWPIFERSLEIALYTTLFCLVLGYPIAFYISTRKNTAWRQVLLFLVVLPFWTNFLIRTYAWRVLLAQQGIMNQLLMDLGVITEPLTILFTRDAVILGLVYGYLPFMILPIYASLARFNFHLVEAGHDLGGNDWEIFRRVILPLTLPGVIAGAILVFIPAIGSYVTPDMLGGVQGRMIGNLIERNFRGTGHWPRGAAASMVMMGMVTMGFIIYMLIAERDSLSFTKDATRKPSIQTVRQRLSSSSNYAGSSLLAISLNMDPLLDRLSDLRLVFWLPERIQMFRDRVLRWLGQAMLLIVPLASFIFLWLPIIVLVLFSFNDSRSMATWHGFTTRWYENISNNVVGAEARFSTDLMLTSLENSLRVSIIATIIATIIGTMFAISLVRGHYKGKFILLALLYLPVAIPEIAQGISLLIFFNRSFAFLNEHWQNLTGYSLNLNFGYGTMVIGHVAFSISYVAVVVWARLVNMNQNLEEAARDLGANHWQTFRRITFPLALPGILGGALLAFTISLDDYVVSFFTAGIGTSNLTMFVYGLLKQTVTPEINAVSTLMITVSTILVAISLIIQARYAKQV
jgi:ABC-type spermidine/putrescine transport system permease subunit I